MSDFFKYTYVYWTEKLSTCKTKDYHGDNIKTGIFRWNIMALPKFGEVGWSLFGEN